MWNFTDDKVYGGADGMLAGNDDVDSSEEEEKKKVKKLDSAWEKERRKSMSRDEWLRDTSRCLVPSTASPVPSSCPGLAAPNPKNTETPVSRQP